MLGSIRWCLQGRLTTLVSAVLLEKQAQSICDPPSSQHGRKDKAVKTPRREISNRNNGCGVFPNPHLVQGLWEIVLLLQNLLEEDAAKALPRKCCLGLEVVIGGMHPATLSKPCHWHRSDIHPFRQNSCPFTLQGACSALYFRAQAQVRTGRQRQAGAKWSFSAHSNSLLLCSFTKVAFSTEVIFPTGWISISC